MIKELFCYLERPHLRFANNEPLLLTALCIRNIDLRFGTTVLLSVTSASKTLKRFLIIQSIMPTNSVYILNYQNITMLVH